MPSTSPSLQQIFLVFLKMGATAFGGNVAMLASIRREISEKKKWIDDKEILDLMVVGNILPGPLATNVVFACGKILHGLSGAFTALFAVTLPSFVLMCFLSWSYFAVGQNAHVTAIMNGLLPCVAGIIAATAWNLLRKNVKGLLQYLIVGAAAVAMLLFHAFFLTLIIVAVSALLGRVFFYSRRETLSVLPSRKSKSILVLPAIAISAFAIIYLLPEFSSAFADVRKVAIAFGSMSVTLFGGGYVFVPAMERVVVGQMAWMTSREFSEGIALGQITPGPIMISSVFIGWKVAGLKGAFAAVVSLFVPPAVLMYVAQHFMERIKVNAAADAALKGVRPAVIGMIFASVWVIFHSGTISISSIAIFAVACAISIWKNPEPILLILGAAVAGWLLW